jgi:hypothetical protein
VAVMTKARVLISLVTVALVVATLGAGFHDGR